MELQSILDNIIFLDIETTGLDPYNSEIIEIGAVKIKNSIQSTYRTLIKPKGEVPVSIFHLCQGLKQEDLDKAPAIKSIERDFLYFLEDLPIVCHNGTFEKRFLEHFFPRFKNKILDSMELAAILEPGRKSYNLQDLMNEITNVDKTEIHRGLEDSFDTIIVVNSLLCRQWQREDEKPSKETLYSSINNIFKNHTEWNWTKYLLRPILFSFEDYPYILYKEPQTQIVTVKSKNVDYKMYESLLQDKSLWNNSGDFNYIYREDQERISRKIRENFEMNKRIFIEAPTGSGKTFAYVLIAAIAAYINKQNKNYEESNFVISTDTKELQNQLIDKDIPNILSKLGLQNKIRYGAIKGKGNYLCFHRLGNCKEFETEDNGLMCFLFLKRLGEEGHYGDLENINYWAQKHFDIEKFKKLINCDSEHCNLDRCIKPCYLRNRYEELPQDNITVVNHSLLASWPYSEKRKITHLILDEAHNLMEKAYDFFSEEFNSFDFLELLNEIDRKNPSIIFLLNKLNGLYNYKETINKSLIVERTSAIEFNILNLLNEFNRLDLTNGDYNFKDEFFNAEEKYKLALENASEPISELKNSIYNLYKVLDTYIRNIVSEDEQDSSNEYKALVNYTGKLKSAFDIVDNFLSITKEYAKTIEVHKEFGYFIVKNTPLNVGSLINDYILKDVKSTAFLSATLRINNSFKDVKRILGQEIADTFNIPPIFNLRNRTKVFTVKDIGRYSETTVFAKNTAVFIFNLAKKLDGHILVLFNNNLRRNSVGEELSKLTRGTTLEIHLNKKAIPYLKDKNRRIIILGSKGFFEGIDVPGDALNCVIIDKIPNINPSEPLYKALKVYKNRDYVTYNYPKVCIKMKQSYGRLIRSNVDYGYFIILDGGTNNYTLNYLQRDLGGPIIENKTSDEILELVDINYGRWQKENLWNILKELKETNLKEEFNRNSNKRSLFWEMISYNENDKEYTFRYKNKSYKVKYTD